MAQCYSQVCTRVYGAYSSPFDTEGSSKRVWRVRSIATAMDHRCLFLHGSTLCTTSIRSISKYSGVPSPHSRRTIPGAPRNRIAQAHCTSALPNTHRSRCSAISPSGALPHPGISARLQAAISRCGNRSRGRRPPPSTFSAHCPPPRKRGARHRGPGIQIRGSGQRETLWPTDSPRIVLLLLLLLLLLFQVTLPPNA